MKAVALILAVGVLLATKGLLAAPLCLEIQGIAPQCLHVDPAQCEREARAQGGRCRLNPAVSMQAIGGSSYCAVESGILMCIYGDRASCVTAGGAHRMCIPASLKAYPNPDPYSLTRPYE